jgi:adenylosuccinate lyase
LKSLLKEKAYQYKDVAQPGRTHGVHAEPYVFGLKFAIWYDECRRNLRRLEAAASDIAVGKISGAVGTFAHLSPKAEERIMERLGLRPAPVASQVLPRDLHAAYVAALALIAALCEKIALEIRHLQRTEVREAEESFGAGQKGSSAMPHKKNPIVAEQICGLARIVRSNVQAAFENIALWHERDISHSSVERVILPDSCILVDYLLAKTIWLVRELRVHEQRMRENIDSTRGLMFSGQLLLDLAAAGVLRERAYSIVQRHAMEAWQSGGDFRAAIESDPEIRAHLSAEQIEQSFSIQRQLRNVNEIYRRVFDARP